MLALVLCNFFKVEYNVLGKILRHKILPFKIVAVTKNVLVSILSDNIRYVLFLVSFDTL